MLTLPKHLYDEIVAHALAEHPQEACGIVAAHGGQPTRVIPMTNAAASPRFYEFDAGEMLAAYRSMDARAEDPLVVYHSHTATEPYPSKVDIAAAAESELFYLIVATTPPVRARVFRIADGHVSEARLQVE